jgi:hypothetical protein
MTSNVIHSPSELLCLCLNPPKLIASIL